MPGYELERFVDLSPGEESELICSICQGIFNCPVVTQCCLQAFCEDCINEWLKTNKTCPYDKKTLTTNELTKPLRAFTNLLGKLKIRCEFKDCKEVLFLENVINHTDNCRYNPENREIKCENCLCEYPVKFRISHDCIKALLELNKKANEKIEAHIISEKTLLSKIHDLETEKETLLKTIADLSQNNIASSSQLTPLRNPIDSELNIPSSFEISEKQMIICAKEHVWSPEVIECDMDQDKKDKVLTIVREQIKECNSLFSMCKGIAEKLNDEFGEIWNCLTRHQIPKSRFGYNPGHLLRLRFGELHIKIFKTTDYYSNLLRWRIKRKVESVIETEITDMEQNMISDVKEYIYDSIEKCDTLNSFSSELRTQMEKSYPGKWQCFCYTDIDPVQETWKAPATFIKLKISLIKIILFKASV